MSSRTAILEAIIDPAHGTLSPDLATYVLSLTFPENLKEEYLELSEKAQLGMLTETETSQLDELLSTEAFLTILKSKARVSLKQHGTPA